MHSNVRTRRPVFAVRAVAHAAVTAVTKGLGGDRDSTGTPPVLTDNGLDGSSGPLAPCRTHRDPERPWVPGGIPPGFYPTVHDSVKSRVLGT
ncbi:hypothetical protein ACH4F6_17125 [Streptomyces sp. NPDC017936]|uniref:hypothetical protein n=1 Tax=Streptomyces sp. NPDC017936 TaxID=3365016 RepID=UPI00378C68CC